jgi:hypothetical protein
MNKINQNQPLNKNNEFEYHLQRCKAALEENAHIDIATYEDLFSIIRSLIKKYIVPNMDTLPKKYRFNPSITPIEIGKKYRKRDQFNETLYFIPERYEGSFISRGLMYDSTYELKEIFDDLYPPQQILSDFYKTLMTFAKNKKQQIKSLKLPLQFIKIILENEEEYKSEILL